MNHRRPALELQPGDHLPARRPRLHRSDPDHEGGIRIARRNIVGSEIARIAQCSRLTIKEADDVELRFCFTHPKVAPGSPEEKAIEAAIENTCGQKGVEGDIPIWHNKIHRARPYLCDGDGPILRFRRYFEQFYADGPDGSRLVEAAE